MRLPTTETANIHILCYEDTVDEKWVEENLKNFNKEKIKLIKNGKVTEFKQ